MAEHVQEWEAAVETGAVRAFARAVRDETWSEERPVAPPTFPVVLTAGYIERLVAEGLRLDRRRAVHGEQEYRCFAPLPVGGRVRCRGSVVEDGTVRGRRGGAMRRIVIEVEIRDAASDALIAVERSTVLEKTGPA